jgi:hypothetical protein
MINPWTLYFDTFITELTKPKAKQMKPYEVTLVTHAKITVFVDAESSDDAIDMAYEYINMKDVEHGDWEVENVEISTE